MQLHIRGQLTHVLECQGTENIGQIKVNDLLLVHLQVILLVDLQEQIAALENLTPSDVSLYAAGCPISDDCLVIELDKVEINLTVGLVGGKVHGSLARAGKLLMLLLLLPRKCQRAHCMHFLVQPSCLSCKIK